MTFEIDIPFTGGVNETSDQVSNDPPELIRAVNATFQKNGAIHRRPGFSAVTSTALNGRQANAIFERGGGAHVLTDQGVYSHQGIAGDFIQTNPRGIRPAQVDTRPHVRVENDNVMQPDSAYLNGYVATVWMNTDGTSNTGAPTSLTRCFVQVVELATGTVVRAPTMLPTTMRGTPHVAAVGSNFVVTSIGSDGHIRTCAFAPTAAIPSVVAADLRALAYTIYDVSQGGSYLYIVAAQSVSAKKMDVFAVDSTGAVALSLLDTTTSVGTSIRGIACGYSLTASSVWVTYCDGNGSLSAGTMWLGAFNAILTTWTATTSASMDFSPRDGTVADGPSLTYATMAVVQNQTSGYIYVAVSGVFCVIDGVLARCNPAETSTGLSGVGFAWLNAATHVYGFHGDGSTTIAGRSTTRGYRIIGRWTDDASLILLGWCGSEKISNATRTASPDQYTPILSNRPASNATQYPGMMACTPIVGSEWDSSQSPLTSQTSVILRAVARVNRDIAYSYVFGHGSLPSASQWWRETSTATRIVAPVLRVAGDHVSGTVVYEANLTQIEQNPWSARKVHANGGVWTDGGYDGGFDGVQSFESSLHQPPEIAGISTVALIGSTSGPSGSPADGSGWHLVSGKPTCEWIVQVSASWTDNDGILHRTDLSVAQTFHMYDLNPPNDLRYVNTFYITDPGALAAIELYGRSNVRIQFYVTGNLGGDTSADSYTTDTTPYLLIDDVVGSDTRTSLDASGHYAHGYRIFLSEQVGPIGIEVCNPYEARFAGIYIAPYTLGGVLAAEPSHAVADLVTWQDRLVSIDAENRLRLPYTKPLESRIAPEWNGDLSITVPADGGDAVALAVMDEKLIVLKEHAIFVVVGEGATATGQYEQLNVQRLPSDVGCIERNSVAVVPDGVLFLSQRGPMLLDRGLVLRRNKSMEDTFTQCDCAVVVPHLKTVVWGTVYNALATIISGGEPVYVYEDGAVALNYEHGQWSTWFPYAAKDMVVIDDLIWRLDVTGQNYTASPSTTPVISVESSTDGTNDPQGPFPLDVQTAWLKMTEVSGFQRLRRMTTKLTSGMGINIAVYADYDADNYVSIHTWDASAVAAVPQGQFEVHCAKQKVAAISFRVSQAGTWGAGMVVQGLTLRGMKKTGPTKNLAPGARK